MMLMIISKKHYGKSKKNEAIVAAGGVEGTTQDQLPHSLGT